jgi:hypothetical protein
MRRLLVPVAVVVMAFVGGVAVAGLPTTITNDVSIDDIKVVETTATSSSVTPGGRTSVSAPEP